MKVETAPALESPVTEFIVYKQASTSKRVAEGSLQIASNAALASLLINAYAAYSSYNIASDTPGRIGGLTDGTVLPLLDDEATSEQTLGLLEEVSFDERLENSVNFADNVIDTAQTAARAAEFSVGASLSMIASGAIFGVARLARRRLLKRRELDRIETTIDQRNTLFEKGPKRKTQPDDVEIRKVRPRTLDEFNDVTPGILKKALGTLATVATIYALPGSRRLAVHADRVINAVAPDSSTNQIEQSLEPAIEAIYERSVSDSVEEFVKRIPASTSENRIDPDQIERLLQKMVPSPDYQPTGKLNLLTQRHDSLTFLLERLPSNSSAGAAIITAELAAILYISVRATYNTKSRKILPTSELESLSTDNKATTVPGAAETGYNAARGVAEAKADSL